MNEIKGAAVGRFAPVRRNTLKDQSYAELRRALITGRFEPGEHVTVKLLAEQLESGIMPVREAVQRLVAEGALLNLPSGRVCVPSLSRDEFDEVVEVRLQLEPLCCRKAATHDSAELVEDLVILQRQLKDAAWGKGPEATLWANHQFHFRIYRHAGSRLMFDLIESVWLRFGPMMTHTLKREANSQEYVLSELKLHEGLCAALAAGDGRKAASWMKQIIEGTADWYRKTFPFQEE